MLAPLAPLMAPDALMSLPTTVLAAAAAVKSTAASSGLTSTADLFAGSLFGASLFPWMAMLYWLGHPRVRAPPGVTFGLTCLLAFVFGTIPAAIGAGVLFGKPLADVDWLHGAAESLLTITNCIVVLGFRDALSASDRRMSRLRVASGVLLGLSAVSAVAVLAAGGAQVRQYARASMRARVAGHGHPQAGRPSPPPPLAPPPWGRSPPNHFPPTHPIHPPTIHPPTRLLKRTRLPHPRFLHPQVHTPWLGGTGNLPRSVWPTEPANALSIATWMMHTSSLVEWLVAMGLVWRYADATARPEWKGVTWGMLPLHTSGIIACTYHLFYNADALSWCVVLQAGMTCLGNITLALACLRLAIASGWTWADAARDLASGFAFLDRRGGRAGGYYNGEWRDGTSSQSGLGYYDRNGGYSQSGLGYSERDGGYSGRGYYGNERDGSFPQPRLTSQSGRDFYGTEIDSAPLSRGYSVNDRDGGFPPGRDYYGGTDRNWRFGRGYYGSGLDGRPAPRRGYADSEWTSLVGWEDLGDPLAADNDFVFVAKMARMSATLAYGAKYGPDLAPQPLRYAWEGGLTDGTVSMAALAFILIPTLINVAKWSARAKADADFYNRNF
jgi:hypothetical protein